MEVSPSVAVLWAAIKRQGDVAIVGRQHRLGRSEPRRGEAARRRHRITARLLIAADGANSSIRAKLGVSAGRFETQQSAIATVVETEHDHGHMAWQCFLKDGPLALLPLPSRDGRFFSSVVWSQTDAVAQQLMALDDAAFIARLAQSIDSRYGAIRAVDKRFSFPLEQLVASSFQPAPRVLLVGDAARVLHPLAGQGVNLGFEDLARNSARGHARERRRPR